MFSRMPAVWTGATHGYRKGREIVEFKMAVGMNNIASIVTTRLCTIVNLYMIKLSIFTSLITNDTPLPATQRMNHALLTVLLQMSQALQFFYHIPFIEKYGNTRKYFHVSYPIFLFSYFGCISFHFTESFAVNFSSQNVVSFSLCSCIYFLTMSLFFLLNYTADMYGVNTLCVPLPTYFLSLRSMHTSQCFS